MGKKKLPKSADTHIYDKAARRNLEAAFPEHWKLNRPTDIDSGIEYGVDWLVQLTNDKNEVTGAWFAIQSKTTKKKLRGRRLGMGFKVSTLNYLSGLPIPVLLHYYHKPSKTGYWMWLDQFYAEKYKPEWELRQKVVVYISTENILDENAADKIRVHVEKFRYIHGLMKKTEAANLTDPNYKWVFERSEKGIRITQHPRHSSALEIQPIIFQMALDEAAKQILERSMETGEAGEFPAQIMGFEGIPSWLIEDFDNQQVTVVAQPRISHKRFNAAIELFDEDEQQLLSIRFIDFEPVHPSGNLIKRWVGHLQPRYPISFTLAIDKRTNTLEYDIHFEGDVDNPVEVKQYLDFLEVFARGRSTKLTNLETDEDFRLQAERVSSLVLTEELKLTRRLANALAIIASELDVHIPIPNTIEVAEIIKAEQISESLVTGRASLCIADFDTVRANLTVTVARPLELAKALEAEDGFLVIKQATPVMETLFGQQLDLGPVERVLENLVVENKDEILELLRQEDLDENLSVDMNVVLDCDRSYFNFLNWPRPTVGT